MKFEVKYLRIEQGKMIVDAPSEREAQKILKVELACGTAPLEHSENFFETVIVEEGKR